MFFDDGAVLLRSIFGTLNIGAMDKAQKIGRSDSDCFTFARNNKKIINLLYTHFLKLWFCYRDYFLFSDIPNVQTVIYFNASCRMSRVIVLI
jgi:hypothetical protein